jgi:hypothetical protein
MLTNHPIDNQKILSTTKAWLEKAVIGLNLCPFAKAVHVKEQIRYVISDATTPEVLLNALVSELKFLDESDPLEIETTLLIHPSVLTDFLDYNDFLDVADTALDDLDLVGIIQIASFHPQYQFAGTSVDDIDNFTNRSPYPILHLLRETSIERAVEAFPDASQIFDKNIETLRQLGHTGWDLLNIGNAKADSDQICVKNTTSKK